MPSIKAPWLILCAGLLLNGCVALQNRNAQTATSGAGKTVDAGLQKAYATALTSLRQGDAQQAKQQFEALAANHPTLAGPHINLGIIQLKESDPVSAEQSFRKALELNPKSAPAYHQLGVSLRIQGRFSDAEQAYLSALELEPDYQLAHRNLGILYDLYLSKPENALEQYRLYQRSVAAPDKQIEGWIAELELRLKRADK